MDIFVCLLIGALAGLANTWLGLGGGIFIVSLLPWLTGISLHEAIGLSLLTIFLIGLQNVWVFHRAGRIVWPKALIVGVFSGATSFLAGKLVPYMSERSLRLIFGVVLLALAFQTLRHAGGERGKPRTVAHPEANKRSEHEAGSIWPFGMTLGLFSGAISGFTGVGGGVLIVPALSILGWVEQAKVVPTSLAAILLASGGGAIGHLTSSTFNGRVPVHFSTALFLGGFFSAYFARRHQSLLTPQQRDWLIGIILLALSLRTLILILEHQA